MNILKLNDISPLADKYFPSNFNLTKQHDNPDGIILRSYDMHSYELKDNLLAVARAGAGVNNIPIDQCTQKGVVVFNTPGANANAVKELTLCGLLLGSRKIYKSLNWVQSLNGKGDEVPALVEKGKKEFVGPELLGKTIGIIGLGAIGVLVANACAALGMEVIGYDPYISIDNAWNLSKSIHKETDINHLFSSADYISLHVPYTPNTKHMINKDTFALMKSNAVIVNCSRGELVNDDDLLEAINSGKIARYVTDFPNQKLLGNDNIIVLPHLGASTPEAEDNCAEMAAKQLSDYIVTGSIVNSVNFPKVTLGPIKACRLTVIHKNVKSMLNQITDTVSAATINIDTMISHSKGEYAYSVLDLDEEIQQETIEKLSRIEGVVKVRVIK